MDDPHRLLDDPTSSPFGRSLLEAGRDDAPSPEGRARTARRLGIVALASSTVAGGSGTAAILTVAAVVVGLGGVVAVAVSGDSSPAQPAPEPARVIAHAPARTPVPMPDPPPPPVVEPPSPVVVEPPPPAVVHKAKPAPVKPAEPAAVKPAEPVAPPPAAEPPPVEPAPVEKPVQVDPRLLAAEVALLDRARAQLAHGDAAGALATLDEHDRQFGNGALVAESSVVRIDTLAHLGRAQQARALGAAFLGRFPRSPLVHRVQSILDSLPQ